MFSCTEVNENAIKERHFSGGRFVPKYPAISAQIVLDWCLSSTRVAPKYPAISA